MFIMIMVFGFYQTYDSSVTVWWVDRLDVIFSGRYVYVH